MTTEQLLNALTAYAAAVAEYETAHPFDLATFMDRPAAPVQSIAAQAGAMIAERGIAGALALALTHAMDGSAISDRQRAVYTELAIAAVEA